jgi:hypothetical protein
VEALALIGLLTGLIWAGTRSLQIINFHLFIVLLPASIAVVLAVFALAGRMDRPGRSDAGVVRRRRHP